MRRNRVWSVCRAVIIITLILAIIAVGAILLVNRYYPVRHVDTINRYAEIFDLDPVLIFAVIHAESRFNENAVSRVGASGLMQIMEETAYWIAPSAGLNDFHYDQILDPEVNIRLGSYYLSMLLGRFGDLKVALAAYNAGSGNVERWLSNPEYSIDGKTLERIPFLETRNYVERVAENQRIYSIILRFANILRVSEQYL